MQVGTKGRAHWRALTSAGVLGAAAGLGLGPAYLSAGLGEAAVERASTVRIELGPNAGFGVATPAIVTPARLGSRDALRSPQAKPSRAGELDCLTQAVYFEARGESVRGQQAVATVIMNRVKSPAYPKTVCGVVYQGSARRHGCQFSFACDGHAERVVEHSGWDRARAVAARALSGAVLRDVGSATHFHNAGVAPEWGARMLRVSQVGLHVFYRFNPRAAHPSAVEADDRRAVFVSAPAPAITELRLTEAVPAPAAALPPPPTELKPVAKPGEAHGVAQQHESPQTAGAEMAASS